MRICKTMSNYEREPLLAPFGFKGKSITELWQNIVHLEGQSGKNGVGLGVQSILWSDSKVFSDWGELAGNSLMFLMSEYALEQARKISFNTPMDLLEQVLPLTHEHGKSITNNPDLRMTFALNALVAMDNAAWILYCQEKDIHRFDDMVPLDVRPALSCKHNALASIPLITYGISQEEIAKDADNGYFFMKIKIGSDPDKDGDQDKMLEWDKLRLKNVHEILKDREIPFTENKRILYYLDANGRYDSKDRLLRLLEYADRIGALDRIMLLEEPFPEEYMADVHDIPVRLAADESAHSDKDALERIDMGYGAIALKPIAKTLSMSFRILRAAYRRGIPCFCADLTVNPTMVDWNKNMAARLDPLPGIKIGVLETNGHQNYKNWALLKSYHPCNGAPWLDTKEGLFTLDEDFYSLSGGIYQSSSHYASLVDLP